MAARSVWLLFLVLKYCMAKYSIICNPSERHTFQKVTTPFRNVVSEYFHACPSCDRPELFDGSEVGIATWPQYGNNTHARISGYAYATPKQASSLQNRRAFLKDLLGLTGGNLSYHNEHAAMPLDYVSWSLVGAELYILDTDESCKSLHTKTGMYGDFDIFAPVERSLFESQEDKSEHINRTIDVSYCSNNTIGGLKSKPSALHSLHVPPTGVTIVSDLDDILRVSEIWNFKQMYLSTFVRPFQPWSRMPELYASWAGAVPNTHFHYTTDAPEMSHQFFVEGVGQYYPPGTFDFRPMTFDAFTEVVAPRYTNIKRLINTFPQRRYVLVGDAATGSVMSAYVRLAKEFPEQVQCLIIRDVSATEPSSWITPNLKALRKLKGRYMLFKDTDELAATGILLQRLEKEGVGVGCGGTEFEVETDAPTYGAVSSWMLTLWRMWSFYHRCFVLGSKRPHEGCPFDRRAGWEDR